MKVLIIDNGSVHIAKLKYLLRNYHVIVKRFDDPTIHSTENDTLIILTGGRTKQVLWHPDFYKNETDFIRNYTGSIIGICLGFEIIVHTFGSHMRLLKQRRKGSLPISYTSEGLIVSGRQTEDVYEAHVWSTPTVALPLVACAISVDGVEMVKHSSRPIYAFQFHPEVSIEHTDETILEKVIKVLQRTEKKQP